MADMEDIYESKYYELIELVKREAAKAEHDSNELLKLTAIFRQFPEGYKDAAAIADECERVANNQELKNTYKDLTSRMDMATDGHELKALAVEFRAMGAYPNATARAEECERRYSKLLEEQNHIEKRREEQHHYTQYADATADMQRLYRKKEFKPDELKKMSVEWKQLSQRLAEMQDYKDAKALSEDCAQMHEDLSHKAELSKKIVNYLKIALIVIVGAAVIISLIYLISFIRNAGAAPPEPPPEEPPLVEEEDEPEPLIQFWNEAYGDLLSANGMLTIADAGSSMVVSARNIRFAELIDFDNDGVPELVLIVDVPNLAPDAPNNDHNTLLVLGFTDQITVLYRGAMYSQVSEISDYALATSTGGQTYLVKRLQDYSWSSNNYQSLRNGVWASNLSTEFIPGALIEVEIGEEEFWDEELEEEFWDDEFEDDEFIVDGEHVSEAIFNAAETDRLQIVGTKVLRANTVNDVQTLSRRLREVYLHGIITAESSLRVPLHRQFMNVVEYTDDAVMVKINWQAGGSTIIFRLADDEGWRMEFRAGGVGVVSPTFTFIDDVNVITITFPTTERLYYLRNDFTGRFSNQDGTNSESLTWTFIVG
jgi:hypothetical protein